MTTTTYTITHHTDPKPSERASARRYSTLAGAFEDMGEGVVWREDGTIAAFHEKHLSMIERLPRLLAIV